LPFDGSFLRLRIEIHEVPTSVPVSLGFSRGFDRRGGGEARSSPLGSPCDPLSCVEVREGSPSLTSLSVYLAALRRNFVIGGIVQPGGWFPRSFLFFDVVEVLKALASIRVSPGSSRGSDRACHGVPFHILESK
jgi:hypothetical protein